MTSALDRDVCRLTREGFEEVAAELPAKLRTPDQQVVLASALLSCAASGDADRERLRAVAANTVRRLEMA